MGTELQYPAGYEKQVKKAGAYKDEPPAAPKGWQYIANVRC
jgi:hypothetical protein